MKRSKTLSIAAVVSAAALTLAACGGGGDKADGSDGAAAADGKTLRLAINQTEDYPSTVALTSFGENLSEATDGRWSVDVYPNEQLGAQAEALQLVADGAVDLAVVAGPQLENLNKDFVVFNLPTVFKSVEHETSVINDPEITSELYSSLEDQGISVVGGFTAGMRGVYTKEGPINTPEDLAGMKIRVQETDTNIQMIEAMGGKATPMSFGEVYTALQSGVIDGAENAEPSFVTQKHYEVAKYFSYTDHLINTDYLVINSDLLKSMSEDDQKIFREQWDGFLDEFNGLWEESISTAIDEAKAAGVTFTEPDKEAFAEKLAPLVEKNITNDTQQKLLDATRAAAPAA
ncbi:TRAP transporter substrate-binding protein [Georgenia thermotolerans]|uniref:DctP family TRAP transporter solute-binding subunit n=1 Tax=Georgenia thermotolerans TaxID=527326 RepID=A0A7J5UR39_9MICO|nr:TRAP transporter substrate-binding protein [Georgenia thermotolerans]KAE8764809.1 DctP family TRAP transporter solute-binding subunit [Georgenia thermotolerans]